MSTEHFNSTDKDLIMMLYMLKNIENYYVVQTSLFAVLPRNMLYLKHELLGHPTMYVRMYVGGSV